MNSEFVNHRICVYRSAEIQLAGEEVPVAFSCAGSMHVGQKNLGSGAISITNKRVFFQPIASDQPAVGFEYKSMVMHAITSDESVVGRKYIFVQLLSEEDEEQEAEDEVIKLVPDEESQVPVMFEKMNEMSALNPDEMEEGDNTSEFEACAEEDGEMFS